MSLTRRAALKLLAAAAPLLAAPRLLRAATPARRLAAGPFQPTWESLVSNYRVPEWFRDAKFGIWAHWSAQCVPEQGDWYGRNLYLQGHPQYEYHVKTYGHPSKFGLLDLQHLWKADQWEPEKLISLYQRAGAKYFVALANHHDNFDAYDSRHHAWNSVKVGPRRDIVGTWARVARAHGLRFGVSNHSSWAARWLQPAYGYDGEGPLAGVRYDAATLTRADGRGRWWEGLDPQDLYTGNSVPMPDGITGAKAVRDWHEKNTRLGRSNPMPADAFVENWFLRCQDLVDQYQPDLVYFDTNELPLGQAGLDVVAHYYNTSAARHGGKADVVVNGKHLAPGHAGAFVEDIERGVASGIRPEPWQTDTCIGSWHYERRLFEQHSYKTTGQVVRMLADIVSKNGNLLLSIPVRGDGTIDADEVAFLEGMARWMEVNGEAIFGSRPWRVHGEGPSTEETPEAGHFGGARDVRRQPYTAADVRFTTKGNVLYAILLGWPADKSAVLKSLGSGSAPLAGRPVRAVTLLGSSSRLTWTQEAAGLHVHLPDAPPSEHAVVLKIDGPAAS